MRLLIDIDEETVNHVRAYGLFLNPRDDQNLVNAIKNCIPIPDNATNGDVIKVLYPNERIGHCEDCTDLGDIATFDDDWWNALYQKGGKE